MAWAVKKGNAQVIGLSVAADICTHIVKQAVSRASNTSDCPKAKWSLA
jgi:hypothetical protein